MAIYPGAVYKPTRYGGRTPRTKGRRGIFHVAVSRARSLPPWSPNTWHLFVAEDGYCEQYVDSDFRAYANVDANDDAFAIETAGGTGPSSLVESEPWTPAQVERLADIVRWLRDTEGLPAVALPDSRGDRRGWGWHRLGIQHSRGLGVPGWRQPGTESWSGAVGKLCPGSAKIAQVPLILAKANGTTPPKPVTGPAVPKPTRPAPGAPPRLGWPLPGGHYVGDIAGPVASHGGFFERERPFVRNVQQWLIYKGCVPGVAPSSWRTSTWADGEFQRPWSTDAAIRWHQRFYPGQPYPEQIWRDDYDRLARP